MDDREKDMRTTQTFLETTGGRTLAWTVAPAILALLMAAGPRSSFAATAGPQTFSSPDEASRALLQAVQNHDEEALEAILGAGKEVTSSGDDDADALEREQFSQKYQEMHRLHRDADGSVTLYIGAENWPFPIPLVEKNGAWRFDSDAGSKEVLFRQIGENELTAIAICHEFVASEKRYRAEPTTAGVEDSSPVSLVARASGGSAGGDPVLFHGYYFRVLATSPTNGARRGTEGKTTGKFALVAYPAEYKSSGVMTFVVTANDVVYERDLGANTSAVASAMTAFHKDATWHVADE